jgi:hypothetical protein
LNKNKIPVIFTCTKIANHYAADERYKIEKELKDFEQTKLKEIKNNEKARLQILWEEEETIVFEEMKEIEFIVASGKSKDFYNQMLKLKEKKNNDIAKLVKD